MAHRRQGSNPGPWFTMRDAVVFPYWDAVFDATVERGHPPETLYDHLADDETARRTVQAGFRATAAVTAPGVLDAVLGQFAGDVPSAPNPLGGSVPLSTVAAIGTAFADLTHLVRSTHGHTRSAQPAVAPADGVRIGRADAALAEPGVDGAGPRGQSGEPSASPVRIAKTY